MKILVTGANGQLGSCIRDASLNSQDHYIYTDVDDLDIMDLEKVRFFVQSHKIDIIINCAAYTNVDKAEEDYDLAERVNAEAVRNLARVMSETDGLLIHISTDYVFGGNMTNFPITETHPVNPTGVYGLTKLHGEQAIEQSGCRALIFRTSWLYSEYGKNFVKTMLSLAVSRQQIKVVFDQCGSPTYAPDLANAIVRIIKDRKFMGHEGIYHFSNEGVCSWYDLAVQAIEIASYSEYDISPCHTDEFPSPVVRPAYSVLDKTKFKETFNLKIPYWRDSLIKCVKKLISNA